MKIVEYIGTVTLDGCTTTQFELYQTKHIEGRRVRKITRLDTWRLMRTSNNSVEGFETAELAMAWGSKLNPKVEWKKIVKQQG